MRRTLLLCLLLAACAPGTGVGPLDGLRNLVDPAERSRRAATEVAVKAAYPGILEEIAAGGGPALTRAFDTAGVPAGDRAARTTQLDGNLGLYAENPGALVLAITTYGRAD